MRIVTDGKQFAIESGWWIFKKYRSLNVPEYWYTLDNSEPFCWGDKERVTRLFNIMNRKKNIRPVKDFE